MCVPEHKKEGWVLHRAPFAQKYSHFEFLPAPHRKTLFLFRWKNTPPSTPTLLRLQTKKIARKPASGWMRNKIKTTLSCSHEKHQSWQVYHTRVWGLAKLWLLLLHALCTCQGFAARSVPHKRHFLVLIVPKCASSQFQYVCHLFRFNFLV